MLYLFGVEYNSYSCRYCNSNITWDIVSPCYRCCGRGWYVINVRSSVFRAVGITAWTTQSGIFSDTSTTWIGARTAQRGQCTYFATALNTYEMLLLYRCGAWWSGSNVTRYLEYLTGTFVFVVTRKVGMWFITLGLNNEYFCSGSWSDPRCPISA